ncbi:hypothetical protein J4E93_002112 [Alternaria ventricosa]|uniref:uncharacterized protein n=1 Tax=Alternaria ventricosa TaxID=1187951 RepID=UPI0020C544BA|nr:uncharacterized protein J4E93_002112 [Alternaria ventricosa]KAI4651916.1 hypothetical protein J4E93_002112 [Alternaria ventricosa]
MTPADVPAPGPQLPDDQALNDIEEIRDLVARRNRALDSLHLDQAERDGLRTDLNETGWPVTLCKGGSQTMRAKKEPFDARDLYALLCIMRHMNMRHTDVALNELRLFFKNQTSSGFREKWNKMRKRCEKLWKEPDDKELIELYEGPNKPFRDIARENFPEFREAVKNFPQSDMQIEIAYLIAKKREVKESDDDTGNSAGDGN